MFEWKKICCDSRTRMLNTPPTVTLISPGSWPVRPPWARSPRARGTPAPACTISSPVLFPCPPPPFRRTARAARTPARAASMDRRGRRTGRQRSRPRGRPPRATPGRMRAHCTATSAIATLYALPRWTSQRQIASNLNPVFSHLCLLSRCLTERGQVCLSWVLNTRELANGLFLGCTYDRLSFSAKSDDVQVPLSALWRAVQQLTETSQQRAFVANYCDTLDWALGGKEKVR